MKQPAESSLQARTVEGSAQLVSTAMRVSKLTELQVWTV
jgi:hypothetical protein